MTASTGIARDRDVPGSQPHEIGGRFDIRCDNCRQVIGRTNDEHRSVAGGQCDECRAATSWDSDPHEVTR